MDSVGESDGLRLLADLHQLRDVEILDNREVRRAPFAAHHRLRDLPAKTTERNARVLGGRADRERHEWKCRGGGGRAAGDTALGIGAAGASSATTDPNFSADANFSMSSRVTRPWGPVPGICVISTPASRAIRRVAGAARTFPSGTLASAAARFHWDRSFCWHRRRGGGARRRARGHWRRCGCGRRRRGAHRCGRSGGLRGGCRRGSRRGSTAAVARQVRRDLGLPVIDDEEDASHFDDLPHFGLRLCQLSRDRARELDRRLVGHHLDDGLVAREHRAGGHRPLRDLALVNAFADIG
mgnify:CR=1 FL=1